MAEQEMSEQEREQEIYKLCKKITIENDKDISEIETIFDKILDKTNKMVQKKLSATRHDKMDINELINLYVDEQIKMIFYSMKLDNKEKRNVYLSPQFYVRFCGLIANGICTIYENDKAISTSYNSFLKLNILNYYGLWYQFNKHYDSYNERILNEILKSNKITKKQISSINWIIDNYEKAKNVIQEIEKKQIKPLEKAITEDFVYIATDRVNEVIFNQYYINKNHQQPLINGIPRYMELPVGKGLEDDDFTVFVDIDIAETPDLKISKNLTAYDKLVYTSIYNLLKYGNNCVSLETIHFKMTGKKEMGDNQKEKLKRSMKKMMYTNLVLNNSEAIKHGADFELIEYEGHLLPGVFTKRLYKGKIVECYEREYSSSYRTLPLFDYAIACNQYITVKNEVFYLPFSIKDNYIQLRDYLFTNIFANFKNTELSKRGKQKRATKENRNNWSPKKLKLETIYKELGITKTNIEHTGTLNRTKKDIIEKSEKLLKQWQKQGYINRYELSKDKKYITVYYH